MKIFNLKSLLLATSLSIICTSGWAQLSSSKLTVNSVNNDKINAVVKFPSAVSGDLYVAAQVGTSFLFVGQGGVFSTTPLAYQSNANFSADITVLDIPAAGIPAGAYPLYQVVSQTGKDPMDVNNWVGGLAGLSQINFSINQNNTVTLDGKSLYVSKGCNQAQCHGSNPASNTKGILLGTSLAEIKSAIKREPVDMGYLSTNSDSRYANDAELQAIADYLKTF